MSRSLVVWLSLGQLISWGSAYYGFALFMVPMEQALGISRAESSLAFSLALLVEGLMAYAIGRWIDRGYARLVMTAGSLLVGAALIAHREVDSLASFYTVWMVIGAGWAATLYTPAFTVITRQLPHDFRRAIITMTLLGGLASTVFIPLVAALVQGMGWRDALLVLAGLHLLVCAPLHALVLRGMKGLKAPEAEGPIPATPTTADATTPSPATTPDLTRTTTVATPAPISGQDTLFRHVRSAPFWLAGIFVVTFMAITAALPPHMVSLLREAGMSEAWAIAVPASLGVLQVIGRLGLLAAGSRLDVHQANRWIPLLVTLGLGLLLWGYGEPLWALGFVVFFGMGNGLLTIVKGTAIAEYVSREHNGALNGMLGLPLALTRSAAPWMLGLLWSAESGYRQGLVVLLLVSLIGIAAMRGAQYASRARWAKP